METLSEQQQRDIETRLQQMQADFSGRLDLRDDVRSPPADDQGREVGDAVDIAEQNNELLDDAALHEHYRGQLADIEAARARLRDGSFGICVDCGQPIPFARLQAYPTAKRCAPCQQRHEHLYAARPA